jgi:hypothetical protein
MATATASVAPALAAVATTETVLGIVSLPGLGVDANFDGVQISASVALPNSGTATAVALRVRQVPATAYEAFGFNLTPGTLVSATVGGLVISTACPTVVGPANGAITSFTAAAGANANISVTDPAPPSNQAGAVNPVYLVTAQATTAAITPTSVNLSVQTNGIN